MSKYKPSALKPTTNPGEGNLNSIVVNYQVKKELLMPKALLAILELARESQILLMGIKGQGVLVIPVS